MPGPRLGRQGDGVNFDNFSATSPERDGAVSGHDASLPDDDRSPKRAQADRPRGRRIEFMRVARHHNLSIHASPHPSEELTAGHARPDAGADESCQS